MEGKLPGNASGHIPELKLNPMIVNVLRTLPPPYDNHWSSMPPPKTNVGKIHPLQKLLPFNVKKIKFTRCSRAGLGTAFSCSSSFLPL